MTSTLPQTDPVQRDARWRFWITAILWAGLAGTIAGLVLPLALASLRFLAAGHRALYAGLVALGCGLMLWIPPWAPNAWPTDALANTTVLVETGMIVIENDKYLGRKGHGKFIKRGLCQYLN